MYRFKLIRYMHHLRYAGVTWYAVNNVLSRYYCDVMHTRLMYGVGDSSQIVVDFSGIKKLAKHCTRTRDGL